MSHFRGWLVTRSSQPHSLRTEFPSPSHSGRRISSETEKGKLHLEAKAVFEGQAGRSMVHVGPFAVDDTAIDRPNRQYSFAFGARQEIEEMFGIEPASDRIEPVEISLSSTAACLINSITLNAARMGIDTTGLEITVRTTLAPRQLLGLASPDKNSAPVGQIEYDVRVRAEISDEELETIQKLCRYSPVHAMMADSIDIKGIVARA